MEYEVEEEVTEWVETVDGYCETYECAVDEVELSMDAWVTHRDAYQVALTASGGTASAVYVEEYEEFANDVAFHQFYRELVQDVNNRLEEVTVAAESIYGRW